jgi:hypothetical protein
MKAMGGPLGPPSFRNELVSTYPGGHSLCLFS